ncbi:MAG TPA: peptidoglycan -binding protein [Alphaproteobacteria bacterium]
MARLARRQVHSANYWPGFVDALATMLIIILFLLSVFTLAQIFLTEILSGRNEALERLNRQVAELAQLLALERGSNDDLRRTLGQLSAQLQASTEERDRLSVQLSELMPERDAMARDLVAAEARVREAEARLAELQGRLARSEGQLGEIRSRFGQSEEALEAERRISADARRQVELLNQQIAALRVELARIARALEASEARDKESRAQIVDLGSRLNRALASKVEELARYRSEFFGRLREVLGDRPDIRIVGDRFVFQSEVLFDTASAELNPAGVEQIDRLGQTLKELSAKIPGELNWVLRVDGHTDRRPIRTAIFPSNWELSTARAISVVKRLIESGIPPVRLAATGFGEFQPLDGGTDEIAFRRNRRIELKLTER